MRVQPKPLVHSHPLASTRTHSHLPTSRHFHRLHALPGRCWAVRKVPSHRVSPCSLMSHIPSLPAKSLLSAPCRRISTPPIHALTCSERRKSLLHCQSTASILIQSYFL